MDRALIICDSPKGTDFFQSFLASNNYSDITVTSSPDEGRRKFGENEYDIVLINAPLKNESGEQLAIDMAEQNISQVILIVPIEYMDQITSKVENFGVITVEKPINKALFASAIKLAEVTQRRVEMVTLENRKLKKKMDELKLISRAKCLLVSTLGVDEEGAHKYIEKQAMDERMTRREVAEEVISRFG